MSRPSDLPEFQNPPLNELVLGVQFDQPAGFDQIRAFEVWELFKDHFPLVQELPSLPPNFETFGPRISVMGVGGPFGFSPILGFGPVKGSINRRYWFTGADSEQLIQFQGDRLLHNWRKVPGKINTYPRYEHILSKFSNEFRQLEVFMNSLYPQTLRIRQCEISYINHIKPLAGQENKMTSWLKFLSFDDEPEDFSLSFRKLILSDSKQPRGRLVCECGTAIEESGERFVALTLTARGAPESPSFDEAIAFLNRGRDMICREFAKITTEMAHTAWGRTV